MLMRRACAERAKGLDVQAQTRITRSSANSKSVHGRTRRRTKRPLVIDTGKKDTGATSSLASGKNW